MIAPVLNLHFMAVKEGKRYPVSRQSVCLVRLRKVIIHSKYLCIQEDIQKGLLNYFEDLIDIGLNFNKNYYLKFHCF
uniref:Uncharacterized protein n=1 Tax=uncultured Desulfobacterium sp. TaxID=201089 RepID=E1YG11_9BACT|nr:unknown protein [uncultured Desulfobacterium sp.]